MKFKTALIIGTMVLLAFGVYQGFIYFNNSELTPVYWKGYLVAYDDFKNNVSYPTSCLLKTGFVEGCK
jgi:hypothetical protein